MQRPCGRTLPGIVGVLEEHLGGERGSRGREGGEVREVTEGQVVQGLWMQEALSF